MKRTTRAKPLVQSAKPNDRKRTTHTKLRRRYPRKQTRIKSTRAKRPRPPVSIQKRNAIKSPNAESLLKSLGTINFAKIVDSFTALQSTVRDLRASLERLDRLMNSAYQLLGMFNGLARNNSFSNRQLPIGLLPPPGDESWEQHSPTDTNNPSDNETNNSNPPLSGLLEQIDVGQLMSMLQSPIVQQFIKQFLGGKKR